MMRHGRQWPASVTTAFSIVRPFAFVAASCFVVAGNTVYKPADPRMRLVPPMAGVCFGFSAGVGFESLFVCRAFGCSSPPVAGGSGDEGDVDLETSLFVCPAVGCSSPPVADGSGDEDDVGMDTLCNAPPGRLLMAGSQGGQGGFLCQ